jgi:hypothetical protein
VESAGTEEGIMRDDFEDSDSLGLDLDDYVSRPYEGYDKRTADRDPVKGVHVSQCPTNPDYRFYSFRVPIQGHYIWHGGGNWILDAAKGHPTLTELESVPGIQSLLLNEGYQINVTKAASFTWDEIEPAILTILQAHNAIENLGKDTAL